jgi:hypothetical protein
MSDKYVRLLPRLYRNGSFVLSLRMNDKIRGSTILLANLKETVVSLIFFIKTGKFNQRYEERATLTQKLLVFSLYPVSFVSKGVFSGVVKHWKK